MKKIIMIRNWFKVLRLGTNGSLKASTFRQIQRDIQIVSKQLETTVGYKMYGDQFDTQRNRVSMMIEMVDQSEQLLDALLRNGTMHNTFGLRWRIEHLKKFLVKYSKLLNNYNNSFLEKVHEAVHVSFYKEMIVDENLIIKGDGNIEIIK